MARPGLATHRKFRRLERSLGSRIAARGALELLWDACYEAGDDYIGTAEDIEYAIGWTGDAGVLTRALAEAGLPAGVGFIERVDGVGGEPVYRVHDLWHHAPDYVGKRRKREQDRQLKADPSPSVRRTAPNGAEWRRDAMCQDEVGRTPSPSPSPSPEEQKNSSVVQRVFLEFPVIGPDGPTWTLSEEQVSEWAELFPGLDIQAEARAALAWVRATPGRRKTARGMAKFLVGWLTRTVNRGSGSLSGRHDVSLAVVERSCPDDPPCPTGTSPFRCHQRAELEKARKARAS